MGLGETMTGNVCVRQKGSISKQISQVDVEPMTCVQVWRAFLHTLKLQYKTFQDCYSGHLLYHLEFYLFRFVPVFWGLTFLILISALRVRGPDSRPWTVKEWVSSGMR